MIRGQSSKRNLSAQDVRRLHFALRYRVDLFPNGRHARPIAATTAFGPRYQNHNGLRLPSGCRFDNSRPDGHGIDCSRLWSSQGEAKRRSTMVDAEVQGLPPEEPARRTDRLWRNDWRQDWQVSWGEIKCGNV